MQTEGHRHRYDQSVGVSEKTAMLLTKKVMAAKKEVSWRVEESISVEPEGGPGVRHGFFSSCWYHG